MNYWVTFNEPNLQVIHGYRTDESPPSRCSSPFGNCTRGDSEKETFLAAHNIILAHANAVHIYRTKYQVLKIRHFLRNEEAYYLPVNGIQKQQGGSIGIVLHCAWFEPYSNSTADNLATDRAQDFFMNWLTSLLSNISKQIYMIRHMHIHLAHDTLRILSIMQVLGSNHLWKISCRNDREKLNKGLDFIGINHYTGFYIQDSALLCVNLDKEAPGLKV